MNKFLASAAFLFVTSSLYAEDLTPVLEELVVEISETSLVEVNKEFMEKAVSVSSVSKDEAIETQEETALSDELDALEQMALGSDPVEIELGEDNPPLPPRSFNIFKFDFSRPTIDLKFVIETGKLPWEIPALVDPRFMSIEEARYYLTDDDYLIAVEVNGEVKLYPMRILNWHKGVNDVIGGKDVFVVWDPLSGNATAFDRDMRGNTYRFGDSGLVYRSSSLFFDEQTQSLWLPSIGNAVTGEMVRTRLKKLPVVLTYWKEAKRAYPNATVMDFNIPTNDDADYTKNPFGDYGRSKRLLYPVAYGNDAMPRKEPVIGITMQRGTKRIRAAISLNALLNQNSPGKLEFNFETGRHPSSPKIPIDIELSEPTGAVKVTSVPEVRVDVEYSYWFSWIANHPESFVIHQLP